ncbi:VOC family protein [Actinokineospora guangxiensis]|uniref:VOC family protein n=1 Tax=Actinokineospora guangxiensis TaxID=1490288 RepID=A0ABW0EPB9_9PSEU
MPVELNHTIVHATDKSASAAFITEVLGLPAPVPFGPFLTVPLAHDLTLDYYESGGEIAAQHYAFKVPDADFDAVLARVVALGRTYWADPYHRQENEINTNDGGRGFYFEDPDGHNMEVLTRSYGSGS